MIDPAPIRDRFTALSPHLNERERRLFAATEAAAAGYGGIAAVSAATAIAVSTIGRGLKDLAEASGLVPGRVRRAGGGRKPLVAGNPGLLRDLICSWLSVDRTAGGRFKILLAESRPAFMWGQNEPDERLTLTSLRLMPP